ncbi:uncharacterized protein LOC143284775 isoform X2 [Babylonia areolata]|uniref:uncharacterized protein LOC143284775 isoform X2 n=1 Tax=Babylonia areolata TaxID=304850 RepID=UPI003FD17B33
MTSPQTSVSQSVWQLVIAHVLFTTTHIQCMTILRTFTAPVHHPLQQLVVHSVTGDIYVGATNRLHRLSSDLTLLQSVTAWPEEDNPDCPPPSSPCSETSHLREGRTKGLVIDYSDKTVLVCSTLHQGSCRKVAATNITEVVSVFHKPIVPSENFASCVMFVGPSLMGPQALYTGAEYSGLDNSHRNLLPSVSSRDLTDLSLTFWDRDGGTQKFIKDHLRTSFPVRYIQGFIHGEFAYFMTIQKENIASEKLVTRISRVCTQDRYFWSYVEIPLQCEDSLKTYHVLQAADVSESTQQVFAFFGDSSEAWEQTTETSSLLCVLDMAVLGHEFNRTVRDCYAGSGRVGPRHYEDVRTCTKSEADVDRCGMPRQDQEAYPSLEGQRPVVARSLWALAGQRATAVTVQGTDHRLLAFVGTATGQVIKVVIERQTGMEVDRLSVDPRGPVLQLQLQPAPSTDPLYVLTQSEVSYVQTVQCGENHSCEQCLDEADLLCGWCVSQNRCTRQADCDLSALTVNWLSVTTGVQCMPRTEFQSPVLSYDTVQSALAENQISFQLEEAAVHLSSDLDLACVFVIGGSEHRTAATISREVVSCSLPYRHGFPTISDDGESTILRFHVHGKAIVTRSVSALGCAISKDCRSCTNSSHQCQWCFATGTCVQQSRSCPLPASPSPAGIRAGSSNAKPLNSAGITSPGSCPLVWMSSRDKEILVHAGGTRRVAVQVRNLQGGQNQDIRCHFFYRGSHTTVHGTLSSQSLTCDSVKFDYPDKEQLPYVTADFQVSWGPDSLLLDNSQGIQVRIYKCSLLVTNCGKCLSMDPEYECGWCGDHCTLQKHCPSGHWLDRTATCPGPQILRFSPTTGPIKGRSTLSVTGLNLGKAYTDIKGGVQVAGIDCEVKPQHYEPSSEFVCETEVTEKERTGTVVVVVDNKYTAMSDSNFSFVEPRVADLVPKTGPRSGGTTVAIKGAHMDTGSDVSVTIGGGNCEVIKRNHTVLECVVPKQSGSDDQAEVKLNFGGHEQTSPEPFRYANDPIITMIEPKISILSGGTTVTVIGMGLDLIQKPHFFLTYGGHFFTQTCEIENTLAMECPVPSLRSPVTSAGIHVSVDSPLELHYGFSLDGVSSLKNVSHEPNFGPLLLYPDPVLHKFPGHDHTKLFSDKELLVVNGDFHTISKLMGSVSVQVGKEECVGVAATETAITCQPPSSVPDGTDPSGKAPVWVRVGHMVKRVGNLRYFYNDLSNGEDKPLTLGIVLGVVIPIIAIGILLTVCVLKRHRKHRPGTNYIPDVLQDYQDQPQAEEEMMGLTQITVVDINGQTVYEEECGPLVTELMGQIEDTGERQRILTTLVPNNTLHLGHLIGKAKNKDTAAILKFLQEMVELKTLQHPRLLPVTGISVAAGSDVLVVYPLVTNSDLWSYLRDSSKELTTLQLLSFGHQIADAMTFLQDVNVVHRNLAARNCFVSEDGDIQLTDYRMAESLFPASHYTADGSLQIRWMAPECIEHGHFTSKTDVWAFGVVVWELLTRGITPYPDVDDNSFILYLKKGRRLSKPKQCPEPISALMASCWNASPDQRPDFRHLRQQLLQHTTTNTENNSCGNAAIAALLQQSVTVVSSTEYLQVLE